MEAPHTYNGHIIVQALLYATTVALVYMIWMVIYAYCFSPVKHIPGSFWSRVSSIPYRLATLQARRSAYAHAQIVKYGPIAVIAPDQVHTSDEAAMSIIYDKTSLKTSFYKSQGRWKGVTTTMGQLDYASAAPTRALLVQCFQPRNLAALCESIDAHVFQFVDVLRKLARSGSNVDGMVYFRLLSLDMVTDILWGNQTKLLDHVDSEETPVFLRRFFAFSTWSSLTSFNPVIDTWTRLTGWPQRWAQLRKDYSDLDITARQALDEWKSKSVKTHNRDILSMLSDMSSHDKDPNNTNTMLQELPAHMVEMMAAGSSTTSHSSSFACWALANYPEVQQRLRRELFDLYPDPEAIDLKACLNLPYLDVVLKEIMRVWPVAVGPLERYTGRVMEVNGLTVPAGVIASTSTWTSGRKPDVFPFPDQFRPERWIDITDEKHAERMRLNWIPFGHGCRACPGINLAITQLKYTLAAVFRHMRAVQPDGEWQPLELQDIFIGFPKGRKLMLRFEEDAQTP